MKKQTDEEIVDKFLSQSDIVKKNIKNEMLKLSKNKSKSKFNKAVFDDYIKFFSEDFL
ncbi:MAG: hypothetical protein IJS74_01400 [Clostridia bacterium]|nr:hypothetical protein [Clostridia bacterium]